MLRSHNPELAARVVVDAQGSLSIRDDSVSAFAHGSQHRYGSYAAARHSDTSATQSSVQQEQRRSSKRRSGSSSHKQRAQTAELPHRLHVPERRRSTRTGELIVEPILAVHLVHFCCHMHATVVHHHMTEECYER
jgi:hypothetical protein